MKPNQDLRDAFETLNQKLGRLLERTEVTDFVESIPHAFATPEAAALWLDETDNATVKGDASLVFKPNIGLPDIKVPEYRTGVTMKVKGSKTAPVFEVYFGLDLIFSLDSSTTTRPLMDNARTKLAKWVEVLDINHPFCRALLSARAETKKLMVTKVQQIPAVVEADIAAMPNP